MQLVRLRGQRVVRPPYMVVGAATLLPLHKIDVCHPTGTAFDDTPDCYGNEVCGPFKSGYPM